MKLSFADGQNIFLAWRMYVQMVSLSLDLYFLIWLLSADITIVFFI
jgi:hypothetical protein